MGLIVGFGPNISNAAGAGGGGGGDPVADMGDANGDETQLKTTGNVSGTVTPAGNFLVVTVGEFPNGSNTYVTDVTIDGVSIFANLISDPGLFANNVLCRSYYLANPPTSAVPWVVEISATRFVNIIIRSYENVNTGSPFSDTVGDGFESSGDLHKSVDITPVHDDTLVVLNYAMRVKNLTVVPDGSQVETIDQPGTGQNVLSMEQSYLAVETAALTTVGGTSSAASAKALHAYALRKA